MAYAFNLTLDPDTSLEIERVYARLGAFGVPDDDLITQYGPCVTLLVGSDQLRSVDLVGLMKLRLPMMAALDVVLTEPCMIAGVPPNLCLRVGPTQALLALHNAIFNELPEEEVHLHYRPAYWQPHLKLANFRGSRVEGIRLVASLALGWKETRGRLDRFELIEYMPVQSIWQAPLIRSRS